MSEGVVIFKFNSILYYANKDYFASKVQKAAGITNKNNKSKNFQSCNLFSHEIFLNCKLKCIFSSNSFYLFILQKKTNEMWVFYHTFS